MFLRNTLLLLLLLTLSACASLQDEDETLGWSQERLFQEGVSEMNLGGWETAIDYFEKLQSRYPFGKYTIQSQLNLVYCYYKYDEPENAIAAANRFIRTHPRHPGVPYAIYLKGLSNFERNLGVISSLLPTDTSQRDPGKSVQAFKDFAELIRRFPDSVYADDAFQRMLYLRNNLARHELSVAQYYMRRGAFLAAANRAEYVVANYQRTPAVRDALGIMVDAYTRLGMEELVEDTQRVIALNEANGSLIADPRDAIDRGWLGNFWYSLGVDD
jgi:outer membrane protein assembly factor BamD